MFARLREDIQVVFDRDPAARSWLEILLAYPGLHAIMLHRVNHWLWTHRLPLLARLCGHFSRFLTGVEIHPGAVTGRRFFIDHGMGIVIGETARIGDDCSVYHGVTLGGTTWQKGKRHPTLENGVIIGAGAKILGPIVLRENSRVGSNAVVIKDVPAGATVVGIPGHIVAMQDSEADEQAAKRQAIAQKIGFDAYGASKDMPDPVEKALEDVLNHIHKVDAELAAIKKKIKD